VAKASSSITKKAKAFVASMNAAMKTARDKKLAELKKKGDKSPDSKVIKIDFSVSKMSVTLSRTPEKQAESVAKGRSWTCASAHMVDKARHVPMYYTLPGKSRKYSKTAKEPWGSGDEHFMTFAAFKAEWAKQLKSHGVRNYRGKLVFSTSDAWHIELPSGKLLHSDPAVKKCLVEYARLTRLGDKKPNKEFESSKWWKSDLKPHLKAAEAEKAKLEKQAWIETQKMLRFEGSAAGKQVLMSNVSKSASVTGKAFADIDVPGPYERGASKVVKVSGGSAAVWDSLARSIFETLGLTETKGFDVKLSCGVTYDLVRYEYLSQSFLTGLTPKCALIYNTPVARAMGMSVKVSSSVKLNKAGADPAGQVRFDFVLKTPIDKDVGSVTIDIAGAKTRVKVKL